MKAKMKPHKLLSMLLALVMVVGMLPAMGQVAYAYSAGDIAGTTGSGASEADPVVCDTFAEFKAAMENEDIRFVKLTGTIETIPAQEDLSAAIDQSSPKTLIVEGKNTFIGSMNGRINCLLYVHSELNVKGSGTLEYSHGMGAGAGAVIYGLSKCSLTIQDVTLVGSINGQTFGRALYLAGDSKTKILSGTFSGYSESTVDAHNTISAVSVNELAELTIEDGSFYSTAGADSIKTYGLDINKATTKVTLNGGTYDGIDASDANLNLSDMLGTDRYYTDSNGTVDMTSVTNTTERLTVKTKRIDAVDVNISVPVVGNHPQNASSNTENTKVLSTVWSSDGAVIPETGTFEAGKTYKVQVSVYTKNDYFFGDPLTVTINGSTAVTDFERPGVGNRTITFEKEYTPGNSILNSVDVSITEPVAGAQPQDAVSNTANVSVSTTEWYHNGTKISASDTFAAGETYKVHVIVNPDSGYEFADNPTATFNGSKTGTLYTNGKDYINYYAEFTTTAESTEYAITVTNGKATVGAGTEISKAAEGTTVTLTANAASDGEIFDKWVVEDGSASITLADANSATTTFTMPAGAVSVKATYTSYITINLAAGEGSGTMEPLILKATYGYYELIAPDCTFTPPANKVFDKWQFSKDDSYLKPGDTKTIWSSANGATLTAIWKDAPVTYYTVSFDSNGGTGSMAAATGVSGDYVLPVCGFTAPNGKQFKAWSVGGVEKAAGDTITVNANTTVTAIWENIPVTYYTVTFDSNGGSAVTAQSIEAGQKATKPADPTKDGYDFKGWTLNGSAYDFNTAVNGNITLVATWEQQQVVPTTYTVSFAANGGTGTMADVTGISGEYTLPENGFTAPDGKQFKAWSVGGNEKAVGDKITVTADTTVTAVWEDIPAGHTCDIKPVAKVEPSCTEAGKEAYYKCEGCGKFYEDALGTKEITDLASWGNIAKIAHTTKQTVTKATPTANGKIVNYCSVCKKTLSTTVIPKASSIKLKATSLTYNGKVRTPKVIVKDRTGKTLVKNTDYTVSYAKGRKYVGKYAVKITFKGKYSGTKTLYFTIKPKATSISSLKAGSKKFTVKWKKQATQTTGYQVQYSASSKFSKAKTVTVGKNTTVSKKISKLSGKKKYYVRVRTYKTVKINGKSIRIYSGWSKAKTVTTKK
mgnify:CR=1 FL=1